ncbi:MAG: hypothetical protein HY673_12520 [Chloroflexi bacterium]|nr:hypothetical protein [Chloroflexota bacterium]
MDKARLAWTILLLGGFCVALYFLFVNLERIRRWPWPRPEPMKIVPFYGAILLFITFLLALIYVVVSLITI